MALGDAADAALSDARELQLAQRGLAQPGHRGVVGWSRDTGGSDAGASTDFDLQKYLAIAWKHRYLILGCIAAALIIGAAATLLATPTYSAQATVQIDRESAKVVNVQDVMPQEQMVQGEEFYQTQYGLLRSRSLAERVVADLGIASSPRFLAAINVRAPTGAKRGSAIAQREFRKDVMKSVERRLGVSPMRNSRLVVVGFSSRDAGVSAQIANSFAENFIASNLDRRFESSSYAREFLEKRIALVKGKLEETERELVAYATRQEIINLRDDPAGAGPGGTRSLVAADLGALNASLAAATAERIRAEQRWRQAQGSSGMGMTELLASPTIQELTQLRAKQRAQYEDQLRLYKPDFPAMLQLKAQVDETTSQINREAGSIRESIRAQYTIARNQERALTAQVQRLKGSMLNLEGRSIQYNILQREVDTNRTLYDGLLQRYKEIGVTGGVTANNISIVDRAEAPLEPSSPRPLLNMAIALVLGLGAGGLAALIAEALDHAIRRPADVEGHLGLALLGSVPALRRGVTAAEAMRDPRSEFWEAYYSIRTALQFSTSDGLPPSLLITSSKPSEGKSTTALALAISLARLGQRTLLVDADLRNPSLHATLQLDNGLGLSNFLTTGAALRQVLQATDDPQLSVITSGPLPPTPAELLAGDKMKQFRAEVEAEFDIVIFDGPPVMGLADAPVMAAALAGTVVIIEAGKTGRHQVAATIRRLRMNQARVLGAILTKFDPKKGSYNYGTSYEYSYAYSRDRNLPANEK